MLFIDTCENNMESSGTTVGEINGGVAVVTPWRSLTAKDRDNRTTRPLRHLTRSGYILLSTVIPGKARGVRTT